MLMLAGTQRSILKKGNSLNRKSSMKISFIIKENRKREKELTSLLEQAENLIGFTEVAIFKTEFAGHAIILASEQVNNSNVIIAVGGDGTLNEVLNGVLKTPYKNTILGYFPLGTANDFQKTAGEILSVKHFINCLNNLSVKKINVGKLTCDSLNEKKIRHFINIADTGLGGFIAKRITQDSKNLGALLTYLKHTITGFLNYEKSIVTVKIDKQEYQGKLLSIAVCNGKVFGNGLIISPKAKLNDDLLQVTLLGNVSLWDYIKNLKSLKKGSLIINDNIHYYSAKSVVIYSSSTIETEADGEYIGGGKVSYELLPYSINLLAVTKE